LHTLGICPLCHQRGKEVDTLSETSSVNYISHSLLTNKSVESRIYQQKILNKAIHNNTIIILPAGMGKCIIAALTIAYHFNTKCIFLTPTKPLVLKRFAMLQEKLTIPEHISSIIGTVSNEKRAKLFQEAKILVMTPNVLYHDIINDLYDFRNVSLIVFDECHRATGKHAYVKDIIGLLERLKRN